MIIENNELIRCSIESEKLINKGFNILDNGSVTLISYHGTDQLVEAAARVSYHKQTRKIRDTKNLIRYLYRNNHLSPFEMCSLTFHLKMPLFVIQQLLRHRVAKLNQESHRYSEIDDDFYCVESNKWRKQSTNNKQGSEGFLDDEIGEKFTDEQEKLQILMYNEYKNRLESGVAKELARKDMPHSTYSSLYWQMDLRNLLHFLKLRCDSHAQYEIREYANIIAAITKVCYPISFEAWYDYCYGAHTLSRLDQKFLNWYESNKEYETPTPENKNICLEYAKKIGMSEREYDEFWPKLQIGAHQTFDLEQ